MARWVEHECDECERPFRIRLRDLSEGQHLTCPHCGQDTDSDAEAEDDE